MCIELVPSRSCNYCPLSAPPFSWTILFPCPSQLSLFLGTIYATTAHACDKPRLWISEPEEQETLEQLHQWVLPGLAGCVGRSRRGGTSHTLWSWRRGQILEDGASLSPMPECTAQHATIEIPLADLQGTVGQSFSYFFSYQACKSALIGMWLFQWLRMILIVYSVTIYLHFHNFRCAITLPNLLLT